MQQPLVRILRVHVPGAQWQPSCYKDAPSLIQPGAACDCDKWRYAGNGDQCSNIISYEGIRADDFYRWNPDVGGPACNQLWAGYYVCVGV